MVLHFFLLKQHKLNKTGKIEGFIGELAGHQRQLTPFHYSVPLNLSTNNHVQSIQY